MTDPKPTKSLRSCARLTFAALLVAIGVSAEAQLPDTPATARDATNAAPPEQAAARATVSRHRISLPEGDLAYTATVGSLGLADQTNAIKANAWFIAYTLDGAPRPRRPITFVFNGGPGSSSAYLHMGGLGPKRLVVPDDGGIPTIPPTLADNLETWLAFTDLVFFDPVGTGWSSPAIVDGKPVPTSEFWDAGRDVAWTARFIRQYLNRMQRWSSPIVVAGESYGGFRAARLANVLPVDFAVPLAGAILISPVIEFPLNTSADRFMPLATALALPSFAAAAWHHGRIDGATKDPAARDRFLGEVERFALGTYLPILALGHAASAAQRASIESQVSRFTGLSPELVRRVDARITRELFIKEGLPGHVLGRYDAAVTLPDPNPASPLSNDADPSSTPFAAALSAAVNIQLRETLKVERPQSYVLFSSAANREWDWRNGQNSAPALRAGMIANPSLQVMIVHGRFDLVTPYFTSQFIAQQMNLPPALRAHLATELLDGGHMMYFHASERVRLAELGRRFYARLLAPSP